MQSTQPPAALPTRRRLVIGVLVASAIVATLLIVPAFWLDPGNRSSMQVVMVPGALLSAAFTTLVLPWVLQVPWNRALGANFAALLAYPFCFIAAGMVMISVRVGAGTGPDQLNTVSDLVVWATAALAVPPAIAFAMIRATRPEPAQPVAPPEQP
ncbi:MAG TPA: hypothetical protein VFS21_19310 [Roseiflexaceae bacterium]|nr:hypothetical protein [Roseiflexaceae bacterium]